MLYNLQLQTTMFHQFVTVEAVDVENAGSFFDCSNIDGALVGGASLDGKKFALIANEFNRNN
jgi:triosephosphate isomerase